MYHLSCVQSTSKVEHKMKANKRYRKKVGQRVHAIRFIFLVMVMFVSFMFGAMMNIVAETEAETNLDIASQEGYIAQRVVSVEQGEPSGKILDKKTLQRVVYVNPGDTLWHIAKEHAPQGEDLRKFIYELEKLNQLETSMLQIGQVLELP